ncbi:MAG: SGNH/GDSL hydrolase family protein [Eubacterium sp.]|nr:SGNH/GDSL hydrolase family protein [Eubacterium sp.]
MKRIAVVTVLIVFAVVLLASSVSILSNDDLVSSPVKASIRETSIGDALTVIDTTGNDMPFVSEVNPAATGPAVSTGPAATMSPIIEKLTKSKPHRVKIKKSIHKKVKLKWKRVRGARIYEVYRSKKKHSGYRLIKTVRKKKTTDRNAKQRKIYFYKIRAGRRSNNELFFSKFSKPVKVFVEPEKPRTVIVGECFAVALELEKNNFPSYYRYVAKAGMSTYTILESNEFNYNGNDVTALEKAATYNPDRLIFIVGANYSASIDPEQSAAKFVTMKRLMKKINPNIKIVIMGVSPWKKDSKYGVRLASHEKRHQINAAYRDVAEKHNNMYYCDLTEHFEGSDGDLLGQYNGGDGLHWSYYARTWMVQHLKTWLKKKFGNY